MDKNVLRVPYVRPLVDSTHTIQHVTSERVVRLVGKTWTWRHSEVILQFLFRVYRWSLICYPVRPRAAQHDQRSCRPINCLVYKSRMSITHVQSSLNERSSWKVNQILYIGISLPFLMGTVKMVDLFDTFTTPIVPMVEFGLDFGSHLFIGAPFSVNL